MKVTIEEFRDSLMMNGQDMIVQIMTVNKLCKNL